MSYSKQIFTVPSGLGGTFDVKVVDNFVKSDADWLVEAKIFMPGNPDFHGEKIIVSAAELRLAR